MYPTMKFCLLIAIFMSMVFVENFGNPVPDNDVNFHVNMAGVTKTYPLKHRGIYYPIVTV